MPLKGQAKTDYQREYMRRRRAGDRSNLKLVRPAPESVRPVMPDVRPIKTQSHSPMMVGYVPPGK